MLNFHGRPVLLAMYFVGLPKSAENDKYCWIWPPGCAPESNISSDMLVHWVRVIWAKDGGSETPWGMSRFFYLFSWSSISRWALLSSSIWVILLLNFIWHWELTHWKETFYENLYHRCWHLKTRPRVDAREDFAVQLERNYRQHNDPLHIKNRVYINLRINRSNCSTLDLK